MGRPQVLVIDEHEDSRIIVRMIAQHGGFDVVEAEHGRAGLASAAQCAPGVIVLDLELRRPSARELIAMLRSDSALRHVPIIALCSGREDPDPLPLGVDVVLHKPISVPLLLRELSRLRPLDA